MAPKKSSKINVASHVLVPKHSIVGAREREKLRKTFDLESLPSISINDPAILSLGASVDDIIKIERNSPTAKVHTYYRRVINE